MPVGNITGLSSGIQWSDTVELLMNLERAPVESLETRKTTFQSQLTNWSAIESKLSSLLTASEGIDSADELLVNSISSSDSDILTADADATAIIGSHDVLVNKLATNNILAHRTGWADADTTPINTSGDEQFFSIEYAGEAYTFTVPNGATLTDLVKMINNDQDNPGVTASIINDGSGGAASYHLILAGNDSGTDNTISIIDTVDNPTDLGTGTEFDAAAWDETQAAGNAELRVDGFPDPDWGWANPWIESDSNEVTDAIPGVTLNLKNVTDETAIKIEITLDKTAVKNKVNSLIEAFNGVVSTINTLTSFNTETGVAGPLAADAYAKSLRNELTSLIANNIPGTSETDRYRSLGEVGLKSARGGKSVLTAQNSTKHLMKMPLLSRGFLFSMRSARVLMSTSPDIPTRQKADNTNLR